MGAARIRTISWIPVPISQALAISCKASSRDRLKSGLPLSRQSLLQYQAFQAIFRILASTSAEHRGNLLPTGSRMASLERWCCFVQCHSPFAADLKALPHPRGHCRSAGSLFVIRLQKSCLEIEEYLIHQILLPASVSSRPGKQPEVSRPVARCRLLARRKSLATGLQSGAAARLRIVQRHRRRACCLPAVMHHQG